MRVKTAYRCDSSAALKARACLNAWLAAFKLHSQDPRKNFWLFRRSVGTNVENIGVPFV